MWGAARKPGYPTEFASERLVMRRLGARDRAWYLDVIRRNRDHIKDYMPDEILSLDDEESVGAFLGGLEQAWSEGSAFCLAAHEKQGNAFVAQVYIQPLNRPAGIVEIGYFSDVDHEGQGYVAEAVRRTVRFLFEDVGVHKVSLVCDEDNGRSRRLAERCGFILEGILKEHELNKDGRRPNRCYYRLLRNEFQLISATGLD